MRVTLLAPLSAALAVLATAFAANCTQDQVAAVDAADKKLHDVCASVFALSDNSTLGVLRTGEEICKDTTCLQQMKSFTSALPDCTIANRTSRAEYLRQFGSIQQSCTLLQAAPPGTIAPTADCSADQLTFAYKQEAAVKDACGLAVLSLASTVISDPQGAGAKICGNGKCMNALDSMISSPDCPIQGMSFTNVYKRQYATLQLACKKFAGKEINAGATSCDAYQMQYEGYAANEFAKSSCGWAVPVAWYPKNDTVATTKLCQDMLCLSTLEARWMNKPNCVADGKNQQLYYRNMTGPIMEECTALGFTVEYATGLPPKADGVTSSGAAVARMTAATVLGMVVALVAALAPM